MELSTLVTFYFNFSFLINGFLKDDGSSGVVLIVLMENISFGAEYIFPSRFFYVIFSSVGSCILDYVK